MNEDYIDFLKLVYLLHAKLSVIKNRYGESDIDKIKVYRINDDIKMIEELVKCISFKKDKIVEHLFDEYVKEYEQEFLNQSKVNENE